MDDAAGQSCYLGSTAKVPIAVAVLQQVDAGRLQLGTELALRETDKVDGSGPLVWNKAMKFETRGDYQLEAGLPGNLRLIHKTGTQHQRACHVGVVQPQDSGRDATVIAVCAADLDEQRAAGRLFEQVGRAIARTALTEKP